MSGDPPATPIVLCMCGFHFFPHQEHTMEISYRGYVVDTIVGQVSLPDRDGNRMVAVAAVFEATTNQTRVDWAPLPLDTRLRQTADGTLRVAEDTDG